MKAPLSVVWGLGSLAAGVLIAGPIERMQRLNRSKLGTAIVSVSSVLIVTVTVLERRSFFSWDIYTAGIAWLVAMALWPAPDHGPYKRLAIVRNACFLAWAFLGACIWLAATYLKNQHVLFHAAVVLCVALLILSKRMLRLRSIGIQLVNTLILIFVGLPITSFLFSPSDALDLKSKLEDKPYSYEVARKDLAVFERWMNYLNVEVPILFQTIFTNDLMPQRNVELTFVQSHIVMNSLGFRGKEIPEEKGDAYRIVALGESTTFGITMATNDLPWPEILEQMIREKLKPQRPVQVINAGLPAYSLQNNLNRLPTQILPLKPDMILSYHGFNGFGAVYNGMPPIQGMPPPRYRQRPLKLLADVEYHARVLEYRKRYALRSTPTPGFVSSPMESEYAHEYRQLIEMTRTNRIRLLLATYSMAVNDRSDPDLVDFFRLTNTGVEWKIKANLAHNQIVEQLAHENPEICFADTRPVFDGRHDMFYDICHFTPNGEVRMAELMFEGIKDVLQKEFEQTNSVPKTANQ